MKQILNNEQGGVFMVATAIIVCFVCLASTASLVRLVQWDQVQLMYAQDAFQEELLLRGEGRRANYSIEYNKNRPVPPRQVQMMHDERTTTYDITTKKESTVLSSYLGIANQIAIAIRSTVTAKRSRKHLNHIEDASPVVRFGERIFQNESLSQWQYFSHYEASENSDGGDDPVKFWGPDVLWGPVHSNDDIWIQQAGGGNNNGYPTFHAMVTTAGHFRMYPSGGTVPNPEGIFLGGWQEEAPAITYSPTADDVRANGSHPVNDPETDIFYVKLNGGSWSSMVGKITTHYEDIPALSWYPHNAAAANMVINAGGNWYEDCDTVWTNHVPIRDTIWVPGPTGAISGGSVFVDHGKLWIEGTVQGRITFAAADTVIITGDITYANTQYGQPPDGDNPNPYDVFGLVSEKKILIGYKNWDPWEGVINDDNCDDVMLYGAYAAIGFGDSQLHGDMACHFDGIFTFQYHHPHGSTPNFVAPSPYTLDDTTYTYVDFHKFIYPKNGFVPPNVYDFNLHGGDVPPGYPCCGYPYEDNGYIMSYPNDNPNNYAVPYGTDWPHYNPVWPESSSDIVFERGELTIYGAIAQTRRGFIHRSGSDDYNHPPSNQGEWDIENYHYDGDHLPTGYDKDYHFDNRLMVLQPPDYPQVYKGWGSNTLGSFKGRAWFYKVPSEM
jgi:hypothetical protein